MASTTVHPWMLVTILNTPPTEPVVDITPGGPIEQLDDLTALSPLLLQM